MQANPRPREEKKPNLNAARPTALPNTLGEWSNGASRCWLAPPTQLRLYNRPYLVRFINELIEDIASNIKNGSGKNLEAVIEVLNVPTGTSSLYPFQSYGDPTANPVVKSGPLAGLFDPLRMWVKTAGQLRQYYTLARGPRETLPRAKFTGHHARNLCRTGHVFVDWEQTADHASCRTH